MQHGRTCPRVGRDPSKSIRQACHQFYQTLCTTTRRQAASLSTAGKLTAPKVTIPKSNNEQQPLQNIADPIETCQQFYKHVVDFAMLVLIMNSLSVPVVDYTKNLKYSHRTVFSCFLHNGNIVGEANSYSICHSSVSN